MRREQALACHSERRPPEIPTRGACRRSAVRLRCASLRMTPSVSGGRSRNPSRARIKRPRSFGIYAGRGFVAADDQWSPLRVLWMEGMFAKILFTGRRGADPYRFADGANVRGNLLQRVVGAPTPTGLRMAGMFAKISFTDRRGRRSLRVDLISS